VTPTNRPARPVGFQEQAERLPSGGHDQRRGDQAEQGERRLEQALAHGESARVAPRLDFGALARGARAQLLAQDYRDSSGDRATHAARNAVRARCAPAAPTGPGSSGSRMPCAHPACSNTAAPTCATARYPCPALRLFARAQHHLEASGPLCEGVARRARPGFWRRLDTFRRAQSAIVHRSDLACTIDIAGRGRCFASAAV
jgi:hypothetical protein